MARIYQKITPKTNSSSLAIILSMPKNRIIITLGIVVALLPLLGFPRAWEAVFQVLAGLSIAGVSVWTYIDKKLTHKAKARARQERLAAMPAHAGQAGKSTDSAEEVAVAQAVETLERELA